MATYSSAGLNFKHVDLIDIDFIPTKNLRSTYNAERRSELKESIRENGVLQPIRIKKNEVTGKFEVVHGFTRAELTFELVAEGVDIKSIPAQITSENEEETLINHFRLNSGEPLTETDQARLLAKMLNFGYKQADIVRKTGLPLHKVQRLLNYETKVSTKVKDAVERGELSFTAACNLATTETDSITEQNEKFEVLKTKVAAGKKITVSDVATPKKYSPSDNDITLAMVAVEEVLGGEFEEEQIKALLIKMKEYGVKM